MLAPTQKIGLELLYALPNRFLVAKHSDWLLAIFPMLYEQVMSLGLLMMIQHGSIPNCDRSLVHILFVWLKSYN
jgi:hypothetical protein